MIFLSSLCFDVFTPFYKGFYLFRYSFYPRAIIALRLFYKMQSLEYLRFYKYTRRLSFAKAMQTNPLRP